MATAFLPLSPRVRWCVRIFFLLALVVATVWILRRSADPPMQQSDGPIFGTAYSVKYKYRRNLDREILRELQRVDESLSMFNPGSVISRINRNETDEADTLLCDVFRRAMQVSAVTAGAFDITVAPLVNLWGFGFKEGRDPTAAQVDSVRPFVGYDKVRLENGRIRKADARLMLDCGAIAKGYAVDQVARMLSRLGICDYLVEIGGEVAAKGVNAEGLLWAVGVQKPPADGTEPLQQELQTVLRLSGEALATSGNYHNFYYRKDGRRVAHTIDPRTGFPVEHTLLSASVLAQECATADAFATAFMVVGLEGAQEILFRRPDLQAFLVYSDGSALKVWRSPGLERLEAR
ncbi:MAG: FAD:protein FMN transferase [Alloprevotella sp.]|nr:FAD:protein FMN transferase [Alloprevotella sp.]